ncbi:hypothetical protein ANN_26460 [Periplaneta americana]|uniref:Uncharacterized protein n=1 Tax=Periplaneta americana TaxID=6978 RepID=A0ABQ8RYF3_PERAM|nr:hypothetical protein ANN_26460 [Periplaneta americana]
MNPESSIESYPAFAPIGLRENPEKSLNQVTCPDRDSNLGHLVSRPDALTVTTQAWTVYKNSIKHTTMRVLLFQTIAPGIPLPPQPVLTHWGTWLDAVNYYAEYYGKIMEVIDTLDSTDSSAVAAVKSLPSEQLLEDILFIDSNFKIASKSITLLESSKLQLSEALNIVYKVSQTVIQNNNFRKSEIEGDQWSSTQSIVSSSSLARSPAESRNRPGRSERLIKKIRREGGCAGDGKLESPGKNRPREPLILVDDMDRCILRRKIQEFYTV